MKGALRKIRRIRELSTVSEFTMKMVRECDTSQWPFQEHHAMQGTERAEGKKSWDGNMVKWTGIRFAKTPT